MKNKISFIVPVYNGEPWIDRCLSSIQKQTYSNFEVVVVDDGSEDSSLTQCIAFAKTDPRFHIHSIRHCGLSGARNHGLSQADGEYIGFVDIDDWLEDCFAEVLLDILLYQDVDIASCSCTPTTDFSHPIADKPLPSLGMQLQAEEYLDLVYRDPTVNVCMGNKLYHQRLLKDIVFPEGRLYEDVMTNYLICRKCRGAIHLPVPLYHYFVANESITRSPLSEKDFDLIDQWDCVYELAKNEFPNLVPRIQSMQITALRSLANKYLNYGGNSATAKLLIKSFRTALPQIISSKEISLDKKLRSLAGAVNLSFYRFITALIRRDN